MREGRHNRPSQRECGRLSDRSDRAAEVSWERVVRAREDLLAGVRIPSLGIRFLSEIWIATDIESPAFASVFVGEYHQLTPPGLSAIGAPQMALALAIGVPSSDAVVVWLLRKSYTRVAILCLLFNLNFTLGAYWHLFVQEWGTKSYIAAFAGPAIGLGCGYLLVSGLRVKDVRIRHATETTTAVRNIAPMLLMMIYPFAADPLVTVSITILNTIGIVTVLLFVLMWRRAASTSDTPAASAVL